MICAEAAALIPSFLDGELSAEDHAALEAHLRACPRCQEEVSGLLALASLLDAWPLEAPSPALRVRFLRMLSEARADSAPNRQWGWAAFGKMAAACLLLGGGFLAGWLGHSGIARRSGTTAPGLALLHEGNADLRMSGILLASEQNPEDPATAMALLHLANHDPSESVRLAAVDALFLYGHMPQVQDRLETSLVRQSSPRVQMAMADLLVGLRQQRAIEALRGLLKDPRTRPEVVRHVEARLKGALL